MRILWYRSVHTITRLPDVAVIGSVQDAKRTARVQRTNRTRRGYGYRGTTRTADLLWNKAGRFTHCKRETWKDLICVS